MTTISDVEAYLHPGEAEHQRAVEHRERALDALDREQTHVALVHALLAVEARIEELSWHVAQS